MISYGTEIARQEKTLMPSAASQPASNWSRRFCYRSTGKRFFDLVLVVTASPIIFVTISILAIAVLITGQTPFYAQKRIGRGGKVFRMWKIRTMLPDAEQRLEDYLSANPAARAEWDSKQKLMNDPRITPLGRFLRKASLDELPQLFNVFNGSMSLVGPRPMMLNQKEKYTGSAYYNLSPGITGLWQVSKRNDSKFVDRVRFDDIYGRVVSLRTDVSVLVKTVMVVFRGTGV